MKAAPAQTLSPEPPDFSLVLGGPLYQMMRRARLSGDVLEMASQRAAALPGPELNSVGNRATLAASGGTIRL